MLTGMALRAARQKAGLTQMQLAKRLGVTQAYLSLMEAERRRIPPALTRRLVAALRLSPAALPLPQTESQGPAGDETVARQLARLGYPGLAYRRDKGRKDNPMFVLLEALAVERLEPRLVEALPWLLLTFEGFAPDELAKHAKMRDTQNRLGFAAALALEVAERNPRFRHRRADLLLLLRTLEPSRLAREDSFGVSAATESMREWLRANRTPAAKHWSVLTDLKTEHLQYAGC